MGADPWRRDRVYRGDSAPASRPAQRLPVRPARIGDIVDPGRRDRRDPHGADISDNEMTDTSAAREYVLRSRRVVTPQGVRPADVVVAGDRIREVAEPRAG